MVTGHREGRKMVGGVANQGGVTGVRGDWCCCDPSFQRILCSTFLIFKVPVGVRK